MARIWQSAIQVARIGERRRVARTLRYLARCAIRPLSSLRWIDALTQSPLGDTLDRRPRLLLKPHRPYISLQYDFSRRAEKILNHHAIVAGLGSAGKIAELEPGRKKVLAEIAGKNGNDRYLLSIGATDKFDREGELMLTLREAADGELVQVIVFTLTQRHSQHCLEIGCLQGGRGLQAQAAIKRATKALHGIRPKNLLLDTLYALARAWDVAMIYGIANASRVFGGRRVYSDYDEFWLEIGGRLDDDGFFALPAKLPEKSDVPSNRRAEYRRRASLRAELDIQIQGWISRGDKERRSAQRDEDVPGDQAIAAAA